MQLIELELTNIKSYTQAVISFAEGVNGIVGANGAGKSTILEAIGFALFNSRNPRPASLLRQGRRSGSIRVRILNQSDERTYDVVHYVGRNRAYVHNCDEDYQVCEGRSDVQAFLQQIMGESGTGSLEALFQHAVGVPQGSFQSPFLATPASRKSHFGPLLNVSKYRDAYERLRGTENHIRELVQEKAIELTRLETLLAPQEAKEREQQDLAQTAAGLRQQIQDREGQLQEGAEQMAQWEQAAARLQEIRSERDQLQMELVRTERDLHLARKNLRQAQEAHDVVERHQPDHTRYRETEQNLHQVRQALDRQHALKARTASITAEMTTRQERYQALTAQLAELETMEQEAASLEDEAAQCHTAEQEMYLLTVTPSSLASIQQERETVSARLQQTEADRTQVMAQMEKRAHLSQQAERASRQAEQAAGKWDELDRARMLVQAQLDGLTEQEQALHKVAAPEGLPPGDTSQQVLCPVCQQPLAPDMQRDLLDQNHLAQQAVQEELADLEGQLHVQDQAQTAFRQEAADFRANASQMSDERDLYKVDSRISALRQEQTQRAEAVAAAQQDLARKQELQATVARLRPGADRHSAILNHLDRTPAIQAEREELASRLDDLEQTREQYRSQEADFAGLEEREAQLRDRLEAHRPGYERVIGFADRAHSLAEHTAQFAVLEEQHASLQARVSALEDTLAVQARNYDAARHAQLREVQDGLKTEQTRAETELQHVQAVQARLEKELAGLQELAAQRAEAHQEHTVLQRRERHLKFLRDLLRRVQPRITAALIDQISQEADEFFKQLMNDYTKHLRWTEDFGIQLNVAGRDRDFRLLSGGEQMTAALAVILALLRSLTTVQFAFFDEPTTNLDQERRAELAQRIREIRGFRQLFIISHDDTFEASLDHVIHIRKEHDVSRQVTAADLAA